MGDSNTIVSAYTLFNSLPNDKILDWSKFKAFADDKVNVGKIESCLWLID